MKIKADAYPFGRCSFSCWSSFGTESYPLRVPRETTHIKLKLKKVSKLALANANQIKSNQPKISSRKKKEWKRYHWGTKHTLQQDVKRQHRTTWQHWEKSLLAFLEQLHTLWYHPLSIDPWSGGNKYPTWKIESPKSQKQ